ncbi:hypothetical protein PV08_03740 [Exophiala spinifera]|uniref:Zn(2)-C6 fungal-type domain-containing protein n=1 Tax=Exophiala spinifera TaxID=91928 RepID=A0A0D1ZV17_9EURO|nr:uncharacterized protein PV08_03740 [Exophiala spinifera]KIW16552.1 hypothetical protein PV08_03740 [Exophiala spinifera]
MAVTRRSRTGCITCKTRRIKCDEQKPSCRRCISSKLICEGYFVGPRSISAPSQLLNDEERRAFLFFQTRTVHRIFGQRDAKDWISILLQLSHAKPPVKHVIVALASVHESLEPVNDFILIRKRPGPAENIAYMAALKHYNIMIHFLRTEPLNTSSQPDTILVLCILAVCFEQFRGNDATCLLHLTAGIQLLSSWRTRTDNYNKLQNFSRPTADLINQQLAPILQRLRVQFALCMDLRHAWRNTGSPPYLPRPSIPSSYEDLDKARSDFDRLMNYTFTTMERCLEEGRTIPKDHLTATLIHWRQAMNPSRATGRSSSIQTCTYKLLMLYFHLSLIIIGTYGTSFETDFDEHGDAFELIANLAHELLQYWRTEPHQYSSLFSFDLGITPPMFFVASRCRNSKIRRKALGVMLLSPFYHGTWSDRYTGLCAQRIIEIEEESQQPSGDNMYIPEHQRIRKVSADLEKDNAQIVMQYIRAPFHQTSEVYNTFIPVEE